MARAVNGRTVGRVLDAHLHLWDPSERHHDWLEGQPALRRRFGPSDVDAGRYELAGAVFVQADCRDDEALDEVRWVQGVAQPLVRGIVAYAPVHRGAAAEPALDALAEEPLVVGVRRLLQGGPVEAIVEPDLVEGMRLLAERDLMFDLCVSHDQLRAVARLVEASPGTSFVLDHLGKPPVAAALLDPWRDDIARLASFPNVTCKLSGLATEAAPGWTSANVRPYLEHALEVFGPTRCMLGSDWPVVTLAGTMEGWFDAVLDVVSELPADETSAVLLRNRVDRLRDRLMTAIPARMARRSPRGLTEVGLGCAQLGNLYRAVTDEEAAATVDAAWELGHPLLRHGAALRARPLRAPARRRARRTSSATTTSSRRRSAGGSSRSPRRYGRDDEGFDVPATHRRVWDFSRDGVLRSLEQSLERLGLDRVDIVFLHDPDDHWADALGTRPIRRSRSCATRASCRRSAPA